MSVAQSVVRAMQSVKSWTADFTWQKATLCAVVLGLGLRLLHFGLGRMLWLDEAMLALNLEARSGAALLQPLDFQQIAPLGWLFLVDGLADTFNDFEYAARLPSLVASLLSMLLFHRVARDLLSAPATFFATLMFAVSNLLVYYSAELKPYAFDVLVWTAAMAVAVPMVAGKRPPSMKQAALLSLVFILGTPFAFAAPAILGGIGATVIAFLLVRRALRLGLAVGLGAAVSGAVFLALALIVYRSQLDGAGMNQGGMGNYFNRIFAPFPPTSLGDFAWYAKFVDTMMQSLFGIEAAYLILLLALVGAGVMVAARRWVLALLVSPLVIALLLSMAHIYPIMPRLALYFIPILILLAAVAVDRLIEYRAELTLVAVSSISVLACIGSFYLYTFNKTFTPAATAKDLSHELAHLAQVYQSGDLVAVDNSSVPNFLLYRQDYGLEAVSWIIVDTVDCVGKAAAQVPADRQLWLLQGQWGPAGFGLKGPGDEIRTSASSQHLDLRVETLERRLKRLDRIAPNRPEPVCNYPHDVSGFLKGGTAPDALD